MPETSVTRRALAVARANPRLLVFPAVGFVVTLVGLPALLWAVVVGNRAVVTGLVGSGVPLLVGLPAVVFLGVALAVAVLATVVGVCNVAVCHATERVRSGEPVSVLGGFGAGLGALRTLVTYGLVVGLAGVVFAPLEWASGGNHVGRVFTRASGSPYVALTYLVGPLAAFADLGPRETFQRSASLLDGRFGKSPVVSLSVLEDAVLATATPLVLVHFATVVDSILGSGALYGFVLEHAMVVNGTLFGVLWAGVVGGAALGAISKTALYATIDEDLERLPLLDVSVDDAVDVSHVGWSSPD